MAESTTAWKPPATDKVTGVWRPPETDPIAALVDPSQTPEQRMAEKEAVAVRTEARKAREKFHRENARGFFLDLDAELPAGLRSRVSFEGDIDKQVDLISRRSDVLGARKSEDGRNVIVRIADEIGKPKEVLLHPLTPTLSAGDVAGATAPILKGAGALAVGIATAPASLPLAAGAMGTSAALMEVGSSAGSRVLAGQPITGEDATKLLQTGVREGVLNAALPLAAAAPGAALRGVRNVLARNPSALAQRTAEASERTGIPVFPSQTTDSKVLARAEEFAGLSKLKDEQQKAMGGALEAQFGPRGSAGVLSEADIAKKIQPILGAEAEAAERGARITMTDAERAAQRELQTQLDSGLVPAGVSNTAVGQRVRSKFDEFVAAAKAQADIDYPAFYSQAAKEGIELDKAPISSLVAKIEKEDPAGVAEFLAPSVRQVKTVEKKLTQPLAESEPSGIVDPRGRPVMTAEVPAPPLTFDEAIRQRAIVRAKLAAPDDPMGDVVKSYYKQLEKAYTESINEALGRGSDDLRKLYETARGGYRGSAEVLDKGVVQRLFREPGEAGRVPDEAVVAQLFRGEGKLEALRDMKQILGANSPDYKLLLRQGVQNMIDDAAQKGSGGIMDAGTFLTQFNNLSKEMRAEAFGVLEPGLKATADALAIAQKGTTKAARIPVDELQDALAASPKDVKRLIMNAVDRRRAYEAEYTNNIMAKAAGRELGLKDLGNLDRFVSDFVPAASAADMRQILSKIEAGSPGSSDQLRQRVLANVRADVTAKNELEKLPSEVFDVVPEKIRKYTDTKGPDAEKYRVILGDKTMTFLDDLATISQSNAVRAERGAAGEQITPRIFGKEALSGAAGFVRNTISTGVDLVSVLPRAIVGNAERFAAVRNFLRTGEFPTPTTRATKAGQALYTAARPLILAAPEIKDAREAILAENP